MVSSQKGFTLLEILLVVAAIAILAGIVIVAINPGKQLADTRNATRQTDVKTISDAVYQYSFDHGGVFPSGIDTNLRMLGTGNSGCGVTCGSTATSTPVSTPQTITDNSVSTFNTGNYSSTVFDNTNNWVQLASGGSAGMYTSGVKDGGSDSATWSTFSWVPQFPNDKELPNNGGKETGYPSGNADMAGNVLLFHLNEASGMTAFADSSGSGNIGACGGIVCPTLGEGGQFGSAAYLNGLNNFIKVGDAPTLKYSGGNMSWSLWFNPDPAETSGGFLISKPWNGSGEYNYQVYFTPNKMIRFCTIFSTLSPTVQFCITTTQTARAGSWTHAVITTSQGGATKIFLNGSLAVSGTNPVTNWTPGHGDANVSLSIGTLYPYSFNWSGDSGLTFNGLIDEMAVFNRTLSADEISDMYKRGAERLKFQTRSCSDATCSVSPNFVGPDGTANTFYTELSNATLSPSNLALSNVPANRYFQYKTIFETDNPTYSPELKSVSVGGTQTTGANNGGSNGSSLTVDACLDLSPQLVSDYITAIPVDSKLGSVNNTYYAIKKTSGGRIAVQACAAENGKNIVATK